MARAWVYILASKRNGTLYIGLSTDLQKRVSQHKRGEIEGFTKRYNVTQLVYFEAFDDVRLAIQREKALKNWRRRWKTRLIETINPSWSDLSDSLFG